MNELSLGRSRWVLGAFGQKRPDERHIILRLHDGAQCTIPVPIVGSSVKSHNAFHLGTIYLARHQRGRSRVVCDDAAVAQSRRVPMPSVQTHYTPQQGERLELSFASPRVQRIKVPFSGFSVILPDTIDATTQDGKEFLIVHDGKYSEPNEQWLGQRSIEVHNASNPGNNPVSVEANQVGVFRYIAEANTWLAVSVNSKWVD